MDNNKCFARGCDNYNIDGTCMYGDTTKMPCQVNCYNCKHTCKKTNGDLACKRFTNNREDF